MHTLELQHKPAQFTGCMLLTLSRPLLPYVYSYLDRVKLSFVIFDIWAL